MDVESTIINQDSILSPLIKNKNGSKAVILNQGHLTMSGDTCLSQLRVLYVQ